METPKKVSFLFSLQCSSQLKGSTMARSGKYQFHNFLFDAVLTSCTAGFWLIWVFVRETQNKR